MRGVVLSLPRPLSPVSSSSEVTWAGSTAREQLLPWQQLPHLTDESLFDSRGNVSVDIEQSVQVAGVPKEKLTWQGGEGGLVDCVYLLQPLNTHLQVRQHKQEGCASCCYGYLGFCGVTKVTMDHGSQCERARTATQIGVASTAGLREGGAEQGQGQLQVL